MRQTITTPEGRTAILDIEDMTPSQGQMLAEAAATLLLRSGMIASGDTTFLTGPHLVQFLGDLGESLAADQAETSQG